MVDTDPVTQQEAAGARPPWAAVRRQAGVAAVIAGVLTVAGFPIGLLWSGLAPRERLLLLQPGHPVLADPESTTYFTDDVTLALLTMALGAVAAVVAYALAGRKYGTGAVLGLAVGGVLCSLVAWPTGRMWGLDAARRAAHAARVGDHFADALTLQAKGVLMLGALVAVAVFGLIEVFVASPRERTNRPPLLRGPFPPRHPGAR